jgi:hypothetical protein
MSEHSVLTTSNMKKYSLWILLTLTLVVFAGGYWWVFVPNKPWHLPPGEGPKAQRGFDAAAPLIAALNEHHVDHSQYPDDLVELVPQYVDAIPTRSKGMGFQYEIHGNEYQLSFTYLGPGVNHFHYSPSTGWKCSGYF